jgi:hypothetical protein
MHNLPRRIPLDVLNGFWTRLTQAARPAPIDPVALTVLALNRLGPATFRTVSLGTSVTVTVPDDATGDIFRAALGQTQKARATDRLICIKVADDGRPRRR